MKKLLVSVCLLVMTFGTMLFTGGKEASAAYNRNCEASVSGIGHSACWVKTDATYYSKNATSIDTKLYIKDSIPSKWWPQKVRTRLWKDGKVVKTSAVTIAAPGASNFVGNSSIGINKSMARGTYYIQGQWYKNGKWYAYQYSQPLYLTD